MCYLVARKANGHGSVAYMMQQGSGVADFRHYLDDLVGDKHIEIITISRPTAYYEYAPYSFVHSKEELIDVVKNMISEM